jgi:hypothetical protein
LLILSVSTVTCMSGRIPESVDAFADIAGRLALDAWSRGRVVAWSRRKSRLDLGPLGRFPVKSALEMSRRMQASVSDSGMVRIGIVSG